MVTDPIANMLISIKNAQAVNKHDVILQYSKTKESIAKILAERGYIDEVKTTGKAPRKQLELQLSDKKIIRMRRISRPGHRRYATAKTIPTPLRGRGLIILSTSNGIVTGGNAYRQGVGGEIICEVY